MKISRRSLIAAAGGLLGSSPLSALAGAHSSGSNAAPMLRLIANENPYGPSPMARAAATKAVEEGWKYALRETGMLKKLIAEREDVATKNVMVSAGSSESLRVAAMLFGRGGGRVVAATPTFSFMQTYARTIGCTVDEIPLDETMTHDLDAMASAMRDDTRLVYVCNPNNPTGTLLDGASVAEFIDDISPRAPVLVDEAYLDLGGAEFVAANSAVAKVREGKPVIVTRTFSKLHGMAGMRVGYAIAPPEIIEQLEQLRVTMLNRPGVAAAAASLQDTEFLTFSRARVRECVDITTAVLEELGRPYVPSYGNFVYFDTGGSARDFMGGMRRAGVMTGMNYAPFPSWARVSMGKVEDMRAFADAARRYFS
ncbi:MAG: pyridoxal phosphate-dependent aminotransferase [Gammaproteobacteria bacterium]